MAIWDDYKWDFWKPNDEPLPETPSRYRKISLCSTCMDRTYDLSKTVPKNIIDNSDYPNLELVLLNYGSKDNMEEWVKKNLMKEIGSGLVRYVKVLDKIEYYSMSHSRNVAFKAATGDIVNQIDADNYTNKGFADVINKMADVCPEKALFSKGKKLCHGRVGFYRSEFISELGGYNEQLEGYGFDDKDIMYRAMCLGKFKMMWWNTVCPMSRIKTPRNVVGNNMKNKRWKATEEINKRLSMESLEKGIIKTNGDSWGKARVQINFKGVVEL